MGWQPFWVCNKGRLPAIVVRNEGIPAFGGHECCCREDAYLNVVAGGSATIPAERNVLPFAVGGEVFRPPFILTATGQHQAAEDRKQRPKYTHANYIVSETCWPLLARRVKPACA